MCSEIEQEIIRIYVAQNKKERLLYMAANPKRRVEIKHQLHTSEIFDTKVLREIKSSEQSAEKIYALMKKLGAEDSCYVISNLSVIDSKEIKLKDGLDQVVGYTVETLLFCPKSKIGYFEGGHPKDRYILLPNRNGT